MIDLKVKWKETYEESYCPVRQRITYVTCNYQGTVIGVNPPSTLDEGNHVLIVACTDKKVRKAYIQLVTIVDKFEKDD